jgi:hypothetical protein
MSEKRKAFHVVYLQIVQLIQQKNKIYLKYGRKAPFIMQVVLSIRFGYTGIAKHFLNCW